MLILGVETSCDETAAAVVADGREVRSNIVSTQHELHARYGGVVPEIAARAHVERIDGIIAEAFERAGAGLNEIDAIAVTEGPGLIGSLLVGVTAAKTLALLRDIPLIAVDHIAAHACSAALDGGDSPWPAVALVVSGGHTSLYHVHGPLRIELLGQTRDDAAGEAFDKVAAILELGYPGGPLIDALARAGDPRVIRFPRGNLGGDTLDFSFSGLKTAVMYHVFGAGNKYGSTAHLAAQARADIAAAFQQAVVDALVARTLAAAKRAGVRTVAVGGGVAANAALRRELAAGCANAGFSLRLTPSQFCTDNAAMIAALGFELFRAGHRADLALEPRAGLRRPPRR